MFSIYESIIGCLEAHGKSIEDIEWVGSNDFSIPLDNFLKLATTTEENEWEDDVPCDLVIVGNDFWIERQYESDDSVHAWWEFRQLPQKPATEHKIKALNYNQFPLEERRIAHQLLLQKYQKTHAQEDDPYRPEFLLREMLYKK